MWMLNRVEAMAMYHVQVKFRQPDGIKNGPWVSVARASRQEEAAELMSMWKRSADKARNVTGVRLMNEGKEVKL
jgi:hypothetical protein